MNRLTRLFSTQPANLLNVYFTAGYPKLDDTGTIIRSLAESGANLIEIGMPYSDPMADGETIQKSSKRFVSAAKQAGVDGLILPDLPVFEYEQDFRAIAEAHDLQVTFLITPQTSDARIAEIGAISTGFIYVVSSSSITGKSGEITQAQKDYFARIAALDLPQPKLIGFGISDAKSFRTACEYANGAIIGSAFIRHLAGKPDVAAATQEFVESVLEPVG